MLSCGLLSFKCDFCLSNEPGFLPVEKGAMLVASLSIAVIFGCQTSLPDCPLSEAEKTTQLL